MGWWVAAGGEGKDNKPVSKLWQLISSSLLIEAPSRIRFASVQLSARYSPSRTATWGRGCRLLVFEDQTHDTLHSVRGDFLLHFHCDVLP